MNLYNRARIGGGGAIAGSRLLTGQGSLYVHYKYGYVCGEYRWCVVCEGCVGGLLLLPISSLQWGCRYSYVRASLLL